MSTTPSGQRRSGYVLLGGGLLVLVGGIAVFQYAGAPFPSHLGLLVPAGILFLFGYRNVSAANANAPLTDERRRRVIHEAGNIAFWLLLGLIVLDAFLKVTPEEGVRTVYLGLGLATFVVGLLLAGFAPELPASHGE